MKEIAAQRQAALFLENQTFLEKREKEKVEKYEREKQYVRDFDANVVKQEELKRAAVERRAEKTSTGSSAYVLAKVGHACCDEVYTCTGVVWCMCGAACTLAL
jgi:hypothetical protein